MLFRHCALLPQMRCKSWMALDTVTLCTVLEMETTGIALIAKARPCPDESKLAIQSDAL